MTTEPRTPEDIAADLVVEVGTVLLGTEWAEPFARLTQPCDPQEVTA